VSFRHRVNTGLGRLIGENVTYVLTKSDIIQYVAPWKGFVHAGSQGYVHREN